MSCATILLMKKRIIILVSLSCNIAFACSGEYEGSWYGKSVHAFLSIPVILSVLIYLISKGRNKTNKVSLRISVLSLFVLVIGAILISYLSGGTYGESAFLKCSELIEDF